MGDSSHLNGSVKLIWTHEQKPGPMHVNQIVIQGDGSSNSSDSDDLPDFMVENFAKGVSWRLIPKHGLRLNITWLKIFFDPRLQQRMLRLGLGKLSDYWNAMVLGFISIMFYRNIVVQYICHGFPPTVGIFFPFLPM